MSKIYNGIIGLVVGDALGVPAEFKKRDTYKIIDMIGYGTHNQPPGTWSDDSSMTLATLESIGRLKKIDPSDIMQNFCKWLYEGEFTPYGKVFDVGGATRRAIERYATGMPIGEWGGKEITDNGNGALMRILPLAFLNWDYEDICNVSGLTHAHNISQKGCLLYLSAADGIMRGDSCDKVIADIRSDSWSKTIGLRDPRELKREDVKSTGYVIPLKRLCGACTIPKITVTVCLLPLIWVMIPIQLRLLRVDLRVLCTGAGLKRVFPRNGFQKLPEKNGSKIYAGILNTLYRKKIF